jgi:hypothetical protein
MIRSSTRAAAAGALTLVVAGGVALSPTFAATTTTSHAKSATARTEPPHHPAPSHFTHGRVDNPWFPLRPGTRWVYRGREDGERSRDVVTATHRTKRIDGVVCRVVWDRLFMNGILRERTFDFYAQTRRGTVWYFGENTAELDRHGNVVSREGSFRSGRDGAEAGIFMPLHPRVGQTFQQENYPGHAEDKFRVRALHAHVRSPLLSSNNGMVTREWTRLEPGVVDHKSYVRNIGELAERTVKGGHDHQHLVSLTHHPRT